MTPRLSVIVPVYQELTWLDEALSSLYADGFDDWEAIVVDDASPVDPRPVIATFLDDARVRYLAIEHAGIAGARNAGLGCARGQWVAFLDQDDRSMPGRFERQLHVAATRGDRVAAVYSDYERIDRDGRVIDRYVSRAVASGRLLAECLGDRGPVALGTALFRAEWLERMGGFDPDVSGFDECDLYLRLALAGAEFEYLPGVAYQWRSHRGNTMKSADFQDARLRFVDKVERLSADHPRLRDVLPAFQSRSWHAIGLYHAHCGVWDAARDCCWRSWRRDPSRFSALYVALKACLKARPRRCPGLTVR